MSLEPDVSLTPLVSYDHRGVQHEAQLHVNGMSFFADPGGSRHGLAGQSSNDEVYFNYVAAGDPALDYTDWLTRWRTPHIELSLDLRAFGPQKELALVFGFDATSDSRLLIYTDAGLLADETLETGDDQFLMEVESLDDPLTLYFVQVRLSGSTYGGSWFFRGVTGYVI